MLIQSVCYTKVPLGVFKVNRVDLVWHGRRANLVFDHLELEVVQGNVLPHVTSKICEDGVDSLKGVEEGAHVVIVLNLRGELHPCDTQPFAEFVGERDPVNVRVRNMMRVELTSSPTKLCCEFYLRDVLELLFKAFHKNHQLLANTCRCRSLTMRPSQHWNVSPLVCQSSERLQDLVGKRWKHDALHSVAKRHWDGCVVDILGRQREMQKLFVVLPTILVKLVLQEVLHSFHVMVGNSLLSFDNLRISQTEISEDSTQLRKIRMVKSLELRQRDFTQSDEVLNLNKHAILDQTEL
mmetsp:Transcript_2488/g.5902  ORF Transcript_2488/g.5902 Transcript_2488/m.5902 type:complete len:295 (+) Transcript_2488:1-885(+)